MTHLNATTTTEWMTDGNITAEDVGRIRRQVESDGQLNFDDVKFLVQLVVEAEETCDQFEALFYPMIRRVVLQDGVISDEEQAELVKLIAGSGRVSAADKQLLKDLQIETTKLTPRFNRLCAAVFAEPTVE